MANQKDYINLSITELEDYIKKEYSNFLFSYPISAMEARAGILLMELEDGSMYLDTLNIRPEAQGKGVGGEILNILKTWAKKNNQPVYIKPAYLPDNPYFQGVEQSPERQLDELFNFYTNKGWKKNPNFYNMAKEEQAAQLSLSAGKEWGASTNDLYSPLVYLPEGVEVPDLPKNPYLNDIITFVEKYNKDGKAFIDGYNQPILDEVLEEILKLEIYFGASGFMEESEWEKSKLRNVAIELDSQGIHPNDVGDISEYIPRDKILTPAQIFKEGKRNEFFTDGIVEMLSKTGGSFYKLDNDGEELFPENRPKRDFELYHAISGDDETEVAKRISAYSKKHKGTFTGKPDSLNWVKYTSDGEKSIPGTDTQSLLESKIKFEIVQIEDDTPRGYTNVAMNPRWEFDVVKPYKIFSPSKMESPRNYIAKGQKFKNGQQVVDAILSGNATDEDITRFFIFAASNSEGVAWGYGKKWSAADAIGDIAKIGIFSDRNLKSIITVDDSSMFKQMKERIKINGGYDIPDEIYLDMANEQGQFTNLKERMRNVLIDAHNSIYKENPNDYFILWRGGNLNRFNTWQSFSKRQEAARNVMQQIKFSGVGQGGGMGTYVINKNNMIDLDALGLSHGQEEEVIVLTEAANKPGAKLPKNISTRDELNKYVDNWVITSGEQDIYPKQGFVIENISQQLNQLGQPTQNFFTEVIQGMDKHAPQKAYEPIIDFKNTQLDEAQDIYNKFVIQGGDFNQHIFTSIPTFYETQIVKAVALNNMLQNFDKEKKITVLDIGATEGTWSKLLGSLNENLQVDVLEPNPAAEDIFNQTDQVDNVRFQKNAFSYLPEDQGKFFLEEGGKRNIRFINFGAGEDVQIKYDVVHESMTFQFIDSNREAQINFIADNVVNDNGFLILEEKFSSDDVVYQSNEELKNNFKKQYYTDEQINTKQHEVITSMGKNQVAVRDMENILNNKFKYVQQYWDAGNFKGYIASNNPLAETFVEEIYKTDVSLTNHEFSTNPTEQEIKFSVQKQMDNKFINKELAKELTKQTLESSKEFINKSSDAVQTIFKNVKSVGGVGLALGLKGLSKAAPVLEPGDILIEKGIEKFTPQLNKAAQKLGFASLPVQKILPTYMALEIGIAAAELVQASMYAYEASQEKAPGKPISNLQESLTRFLLPKSVEDEAIDKLRYKENVMRDFYNTPTGKAVLEEVDFGSQLVNQLGEERVARYSPGWNLSKAIFGLFGKIGEEQANISEQTRGNMGQALLTGIGK